MIVKGMYRSVMIECGVQCVVMVGLLMKLQLLVDNFGIEWVRVLTH